MINWGIPTFYYVDIALYYKAWNQTKNEAKNQAKGDPLVASQRTLIKSRRSFGRFARQLSVLRVNYATDYPDAQISHVNQFV